MTKVEFLCVASSMQRMVSGPLSAAKTVLSQFTLSHIFICIDAFCFVGLHLFRNSACPTGALQIKTFKLLQACETMSCQVHQQAHLVEQGEHAELHHAQIERNLCFLGADTCRT